MPTSDEIYQTYLRGPAAVIRLFEQALGTQAIYGPPDPDMQQRTIDALAARSRITVSEATVSRALSKLGLPSKKKRAASRRWRQSGARSCCGRRRTRPT
jgi:hypothetical protein